MNPKETKHSPAIGPGCAGPSINVPQAESIVRPHRPQAQLPLSGAEPFATNPSDLAMAGAEPRKHTQYPMVTGTSVLAFTYKDGVMMACDTLGAYGSTKRYKSVQRIYQVNKNCIVGASGEISDFQNIKELLAELDMEDYVAQDGIQVTPRQVHAYLVRVMYNRRNKFDPLWNSLIVAGVDNGKPFCAMVSMIGVHFDDQYACTGFSAHLGLPLIREKHAADMSEEAAVALMHDALKVCFYRDKDSINKFIMAKVTSTGVEFTQPFAVATEWNYKLMQNPTKFSIGAW
eukprot:TRINITY_DN3606_c0_g1_i1.p1 TRINITY_DN3606_c0_g1~~TRINITY_DN3606_c0_g1_i1.p1  ORF type:complete len:288 (-),score=16.81 TRINITY_DN3606_c0_g1_i1:276-1139(-)